jgi:uncharacterized small protein (DUF1192 family)
MVMALTATGCSGGGDQNSSQSGTPDLSDRDKALGSYSVGVEKRFAAIKDPIDRAKAEIAAGEKNTGLSVLELMTPAERKDPRFAPLYAKLEAENNAKLAADTISDLDENLGINWPKEIADQPVTEPTDADELRDRENFFGTMASYLEAAQIDGSDGNPVPMPPKTVALKAKLRADLAAKQVKVFPLLRRAYVKILAAKVWENDVYVTGTGRSITFTGALFAANADIAASHEALVTELLQLRFNREIYEWCHGCGGSHYDLVVPPDAAVGRWDGQRFVPIK